MTGQRLVVSDQDDSLMLRLHASFYGIPVISKPDLKPGTVYLLDLDELCKPPEPRFLD